MNNDGATNNHTFLYYSPHDNFDEGDTITWSSNASMTGEFGPALHGLAAISSTNACGLSDLQLYNNAVTTSNVDDPAPSIVTCTDSPTAGPNKGTTTTFTLGADHFEFRSPCRAGTCPRTAQSAALAHSARESQTELMKKRMQTLFPVLTPS